MAAAKYTKQQLEGQYQRLPDELKDALLSIDIADKIFGLGKKFGITIEKTGFMAEETGYVILGLTRPKDFSKALQDRLDLLSDELEELVKDINRQIFFPLREALKKAYDMEIKAEMELPPAAPPTAPPPPAPAPPVQPPKIPPIDLRKPPMASPPSVKEIVRAVKPPPPSPLRPTATEEKPKVETVRGVIFAPAIIKEETGEPKIGEKAKPEKKPSYGYDPYREQAE